MSKNENGRDRLEALKDEDKNHHTVNKIPEELDRLEVLGRNELPELEENMAEIKSELKDLNSELENVEKEFLVEYETVMKQYTNLVAEVIINEVTEIKVASESEESDTVKGREKGLK